MKVLLANGCEVDYGPHPIPTFDQFVESRKLYGGFWREVRMCAWHAWPFGWLPGFDAKGWRWPTLMPLLFALRLRVPNDGGWYSLGAKGAGWSLPWNWYRKYYAARTKGLYR